MKLKGAWKSNSYPQFLSSGTCETGNIVLETPIDIDTKIETTIKFIFTGVYQQGRVVELNIKINGKKVKVLNNNEDGKFYFILTKISDRRIEGKWKSDVPDDEGIFYLIPT